MFLDYFPSKSMKKWIRSKTIWYNVVTGLGILLAVLGSYGVTPDPEIVTKVVEINTTLAPLVNIWLRSITKTGLTT